MELDRTKPYRDFVENAFRHRKNLTELVNTLDTDGKKIVAYGAIIKGNVLLQFSNYNTNHIQLFIVELNEDKFCSYTLGTIIPIISEKKP